MCGMGLGGVWSEQSCFTKAIKFRDFDQIFAHTKPYNIQMAALICDKIANQFMARRHLRS